MYILSTPENAWVYSDLSKAVSEGNRLVASGKSTSFGVVEIGDGVNIDHIPALVPKHHFGQLQQNEENNKRIFGELTQQKFQDLMDEHYYKTMLELDSSKFIDDFKRCQK
jgi:hypothetical protein